MRLGRGRPEGWWSASRRLGVLHRSGLGPRNGARDRVMFDGSHEAGRVVRRSSCRPGESMKSPGVRRAAVLRRRRDADAGPASLVSPRSPSSAAATGGLRAGAVGPCAPVASFVGCLTMTPPTCGSMTTPPGHTSSRSASQGAAWLAVLLVLVTVLAGCSGQSAPEPAQPETPPSASDSASDEPSTAAPSPSVEGPPEMPEVAEGPSRRSAEEFVQYTIELLNYTNRTLNAQPLRRISSDECAACSAISDDVEALREAGGSLEGGLWRLSQADAIGVTVNKVQLVQAVVEIAPQKVRDGDGGKATSYGGGRAFYDFRLMRSGSDWVVISIQEGSE